jgi:hypothetical protein
LLVKAKNAIAALTNENEFLKNEMNERYSER